MKSIKLKAGINMFNQRFIYCFNTDNDERIATVFEHEAVEFQNKQFLSTRECEMVLYVSLTFMLFWENLINKIEPENHCKDCYLDSGENDCATCKYVTK